MEKKKGALIVIEGTDGAGKRTQAEKLAKWTADNLTSKCCMVSFPEYSSDSSALVKAYLAGRYGTAPESVNPYAASTFFAVDRYASFKENEWGRQYDAGGVVIADRYTTSNAVHQAGKITSQGGSRLEVVGFLDWLFDFEYHKMGIPEPDLVVYLDMPIDVTINMMKMRAEEDSSHVTDIHEKDIGYLRRCRENGLYVAQTCGWPIISCAADGWPRDIESIHREIVHEVQGALDVFLRKL